jgi:flagellin-like protein
MVRESRGVSSVISTILMVAIAVIPPATISVFVLDLGEDIQNPGPDIAQSSGEFIAGSSASGVNRLVVVLPRFSSRAVDT